MWNGDDGSECNMIAITKWRRGFTYELYIRFCALRAGVVANVRHRSRRETVDMLAILHVLLGEGSNLISTVS